MGLIVNPVAGLGGAVALHGTDGVVDEARRRGATAMAAARTARALARLDAPAGTAILAAGGAMGAQAARAAGFDPLIATHPPGRTTAADTAHAAEAMRRAGAELILFAGGDGTARDIIAAIGTEVPVIGIPAGVKMHSAVFAASPEAAGVLAGDMLRSAPGRTALCCAEVVDLDEDLRRQGVTRTRLYGIAHVPAQPLRMQQAKRCGPPAGVALRAACAEVAQDLAPGCLHVIGPGTTTSLVMAALGLPGTLLGVDAVRDGRLLGADLSQADILDLIGDAPVRIIVGVVGGQGFLFGRGNQQIGPEVIRRAGRGGITVLAEADKIAALQGGALLVDTGDPEVDALLHGYLRVQTAPDHVLMCRVQ